MNKDYVFHINWEDRHKKEHRVGVLAQINNIFYLILKNEESAKAAYDNGYGGLPGFKADEVYTSEKKLFDFFERRVLEKDSEKQCEELSKTGGVSMVDSFSVEEISKRVSEKYKKVILEAYNLQLRKMQMQEEKKERIPQKASKEENSSNELPDIL